MRNKSIFIVMTFIVGVLAVGCSTPSFTLITKEVTVEYGDEISTDLSEYIRGDSDAVKNAVLDISRVDVYKIGTYDASISYKNEEKDFTFKVVDMKAPDIKITKDTYVIQTGTTINTESVIESIDDVSEYEYGFSDDLTKADDDKVLLKELSFKEEGSYQEEICARDKYGNCAVEQFTVIVANDPGSVKLPSESGDNGEYMNPASALTIGNDLSIYSAEAVSFGIDGSVDPNTNRPTGLDYYTSRYDKYAVDYIQPESDFVFLTFNEIYEYGNTAKILDSLNKKKVNAVFFVTLSYAQSNKELVQRMIDEGHVVGNYSASAGEVTNLSATDLTSEIDELTKYIKDNFNYDMYLFRHPSGTFSELSLAIAQSLGYRSVFWSYAYQDWDVNNQPDENKALTNIIASLHGGEIFGLSGSSATNMNILEKFIDSTLEKGYKFGNYQKIK